MATTQELQLLIKAKQEVDRTFAAVTKRVEELEGKTKKTATGFDKARKAVNTFAKSHQQSMAAVGKALGLAVGGVTALGASIAALGIRGTEIAGVRQAFEGLSDAANQNADAILASSAAASRGMISNYDAMAMANKGLLLGLPLTAESMGTMAKTAIALGKAMKQGASQSMDDLITGLGRGSALILDNLGIVLDTSGAYDRYAASIGKSAKELTAQEQKVAIFNDAMSAAQEKLKELGEFQLTFADRLTIVKVGLQNFVDGLAEGIAKSPVLNAALESIGESMMDAFGADRQETIKTIIGYVDDFAMWVLKAAKVAVSAAKGIGSVWYGLKAIFNIFAGALAMIVEKVAGLIATIVEKTGAAMRSMGEKLAMAAPALSMFVPGAEQVAAAMGKVGDVVGGVGEAVRGVADEAEVFRRGLTQNAEDAISGYAEMARTLDTVKIGIDGTLQKMRAAKGETVKMGGAVEQVQKVTQEVAESEDWVKKSVEESNASLREQLRVAMGIYNNFTKVRETDIDLTEIDRQRREELEAIAKAQAEAASGAKDLKDEALQAGDVFAHMAQAVQQIGESIGGWVGEMVTGFGNALQLAEGIARTMSGKAWSQLGDKDKLGIAGSVFSGAMDIFQGGQQGGVGKGALGGAAKGAMIGSVIPGVGTAIGGVVGGALGALGGLFGGGKKKKEERQKLLDDSLSQLDAIQSKMDAFVDDSIGKGLSGLTTLFEGFVDGGNLTQESLDQLAILGVASFEALRKEGYSTVEAMRAMGDSLDAALVAAEEGGLDLTGMFGDLTTFRALVQEHEGLVAQAESLDDVLNMLRSTGSVTFESFQTMLGLTAGKFNELISAGFSQNQALSLLAPQLLALKNTAGDYGLAIDASTQALIDQAEASGALDDVKDPMEEMVELQRMQLEVTAALLKAFGEQLPASVQKYINALREIPTIPGPPTTTGGGSGVPGYSPNKGTGGGNYPGYAVGGTVPYTPGGAVVKVAEAETEHIMTKAQLRAMGAEMVRGALGARGGGGGGQRTLQPVIFQIGRHEFGRIMLDLSDTGDFRIKETAIVPA